MDKLLYALVTASVLLAAGVTAGPAGAATGSPHSGETWVSRYDGGFDEAKAVAISPDGSRVFVTGRSHAGTTGYDYATVAYSASTGSLLWVQRYDGTGNGTDEANAIAVSPDGTTVFVTGDSLSPSSSYDYVTIAYSASTGAVLWSKAYNGLGNLYDYARSVGVSPDGSRVFVTGESLGATSGYDYATVAYSASTGSLLWSKRYNGTANGMDLATSLAVSPDGSKVYVTGSATMSGQDEDYVTLAYAAGTGAVVWGKDYNGPANNTDRASQVAASRDGFRVFVTGYSVGASGSYDYATIGINSATGGSLWVRRYKGPGNDDDLGLSVTGSSDSSKVYVTGYSYGSGTGYDYATFAYSASTGIPVWSQRFNGPANSDDYAFAVAATPDGQYVYVTGEAYNGSSSYDYATVAYDASGGGLVGSRLYNGPANGPDSANAIAVRSTLVFVTGASFGAGTDYDYATAAYSI
jgi:PQQ-like domain